MTNETFEYGGHTFYPYAKYTVDRRCLEQFFNYLGDLKLDGVEYNRRDFYDKATAKNCDVFYCIDDSTLYVPTATGLTEFYEPPIADACKARVFKDYEIILSFYVGAKEVVVGENQNAEYRYICAYYDSNEIFESLDHCEASNDYLEIMSLFLERAKEQVELCKQRSKDGSEIIQPDMYTPIKYDDDIKGKVVVEKIDDLRREYQNAENQLFYVTGGNGAKANARGTKVFGYSFFDKKHCYINRYSIAGIMDKDKLPDWARKDLAAIKKQIKRERKEVR